MVVRLLAGLAGCLLVAGAAPTRADATAPEGARAATSKDRNVAPERELPPRQPPIAPEAGRSAAPVSPGVAPPSGPARPPEPQAVLVQGYVKTASANQLVLSAPGTADTLTLAIDPETKVLAANEGVSVEDLKQGQLVRAALVPSGDDLVAVVVEVMPGEAPRSPSGALPPAETPPPGNRPPANGIGPPARPPVR